MKKIFILLFAAFFSIVLLQLNSHKALATCMTITGSVSLNSGQWPAGAGGLQLACAGDSPPGPSQCTGNSQAVMPGGSFTFSKCSCLAGPCLSIANASVPPGCSFESSVNFCGQNGDTVQAPIRLNCPPPATPCPGGVSMCGNSSGGGTSCANGADTSSWHNNTGYDNWCSANAGGGLRPYCYEACKPAVNTPTASSTPAPVCGANCSANPNICQNIVGCNYCNPGSHTCTAPPVTNPPVTNPPVTNPPVTNPPVTNPPVTQPPVCGADCSQNPNVCQNLAGCNFCNPTNKKCEAPPICGADCSQNPNICQNISGCNYCNPTNKKCEAQPSPTPTSTPSPTQPPFDESMCSCDSLNFTPITLGATTKVTAYGKVLGVNKNYAKIPTFTFTWYQSPPNSAAATIKKQDKVNTTIVEDTAEKVRYQAIWDLQVPTDLDTTQTYRIQAHPDCSRKAAAAYFNENTAVMGTATAKKLSFWDRIAGFFAGIFNVAGGGTPQAVGPTATPTLTPRQKTLQLKTFKPVNVSTGVDAKNCTFIKFSF